MLLLYDVTCEKSFLNVREWVDMVEVMPPPPPLVLLSQRSSDVQT